MLDQKPFESKDPMPFESAELASNPEPRCPCVLVLDTSGSMNGAPIAALNAGVTTYKDELAADALAAKRVEVAVVTFGGSVTTVCEFTAADAFVAPTLSAAGETPMGEAVHRALDLVAQRKETLKASGVSYYRPWVFLITDGAPTDEWQSAAERVKKGEQDRGFSFFCVGVAGANFDVLKQIATREPLKLDGLRFRDLFVWLSSSQKVVSRSRKGDKVDLPPTTWGQLET